MIERLEINFNQVRQFSTDVSHELRTPITIVRGQLEVALFTAQTADQYRDAIVNSLSDIERLSAIVRALLLLSQAETGQVVLQKQNLDLVELTAETVDQLRKMPRSVRPRSD
jgi:signal transduction histidine kinase